MGTKCAQYNRSWNLYWSVILGLKVTFLGLLYVIYCVLRTEMSSVLAFQQNIKFSVRKRGLKRAIYESDEKNCPCGVSEKKF
jgi:hypothetical protein